LNFVLIRRDSGNQFNCIPQSILLTRRVGDLKRAIHAEALEARSSGQDDALLPLVPWVGSVLLTESSQWGQGIERSLREVIALELTEAVFEEFDMNRDLHLGWEGYTLLLARLDQLGGIDRAIGPQEIRNFVLGELPRAVP